MGILFLLHVIHGLSLALRVRLHSLAHTSGVSSIPGALLSRRRLRALLGVLSGSRLTLSVDAGRGHLLAAVLALSRLLAAVGAYATVGVVLNQPYGEDSIGLLGLGSRH